MARVARDIVVNAPLSSVYNQWTQFEEFPRFMEGVQEVRQLDDRHLHWRAEIAGKDLEWESEIREQIPDEKIVWVSPAGEGTAGLVQFESRDGGGTEGPQTNVHLEMSYEPEGAMQSIGDMLGIVERRVEGDLERFKEFIEERQMETGAWRGELDNPDAPGGHTRGEGSPREQ